ncbi:MAG: glycine cleavage system aminomethyltransferase GcvT [Chthoniobacteraceae bacterium]
MTATPALKTTPLYEEHLRHGAKMIDFGGWLMPVQYSGIMDEHLAVRANAGLFDISHMGQFTVSGARAGAWLNRLLTNNIERLAPGHGQYTFLLNEQGGVIDDLIVYRLRDEEYLLIVNAAKVEEDFAWMKERIEEGIGFANRSADYAGLALQGPKAPRLFDELFGGSRPGRNEVRQVTREGTTYVIACTGYTGEEGYELFFPATEAAAQWNRILERGADAGIKPCGLGARDTLRLEMCYPLNGSDLLPERTPLEAGLSIFVDLNKPEFVGREALIAQRDAGIPYRLAPIRMTEKGPPPRAHYPVLKDGAKVAELSSGTLSPSLGIGIGMAYLPARLARIGEELQIEIRGRPFAAVVERKPFKKPA